MGATANLGLLISANAAGGDAVGKLADQVGKLVEKIDQAADRAKKPSGMDKFAENVKNFIQNPLDEAGNYAEAFLKKIGPIGATLSVSATAVAVFATASYKAMSDLARLGDQIEDMASRTGLSVQQVGELSFALKRSGGEIATLERGIFELTRSLYEGGEEGRRARNVLSDMGISLRDSNGEMRSSAELLLLVSDGLARMKEAGERNAAAMLLFKRAAREILPDLMELSEGIRRARELGIAPTENDVTRWGEYQKQIAEVDGLWEQLVRKLKEPIAATISVTLRAAGPVMTLLSLATGGLHNAQVAAEEAERAQAGMSENRILHRMIRQSQQRGRAMIAVDQSRYYSTAEGLTALLQEARAAEERARREYFESAGQTADIVSKNKQAWEESAAAVAKYKVQLDALKKAEEERNKVIEYQRQQLEKGREYIFGDLSVGRGLRMEWLPGYYEFGSPARSRALDAYLRDLSLGRLPGRGAGGFDLEGIAEGTQRWWQQFRQEQNNLQRAAIEHQVRMIQLLAGPGGELDAARKIAALRLSTAETLLERQQAIHELEEAQAEIQRRRLEDIRHTAGEVFDAMLRGGAGLQEMLTGQMRVWQRTIFQNLAVELFKGMAGRFSLPGTTGPGGQPTLLGRILQGTPFGPDPLKVATDMNTLATQQNTAALMQVTASLSAFGIGGGLPAQSGFGKHLWMFGPQGMAPAGGTNANWWTRNANTLSMIGAGAAGAFGIYQGIQQGGAQGALTAAASGAASFGAIASLTKSLKFLGPFGVLAGMGLGFAASLFGDPKQKRAERIQEEAERRSWEEPMGTEYSYDLYGRALDRDLRGRVRVVHTYHVNIQAVDAPSFERFLVENPAALATGITHAIASGNGEDVIGTLRQAAMV